MSLFIFIFCCWFVWFLIRISIEDIKEKNKKNSSPTYKKQTITTQKVEEYKKSNYRNKYSSNRKYSPFRRLHDTEGGCICGCNGRKFHWPDESIDLAAYAKCPVRWKRKYREADLRKEANARTREKKKEQLIIKKTLQKQKHIEKKDLLKKTQQATWIAQGPVGEPAKSQEEAKFRQLNTYIGKPCSLGHTERLTRNSECVICKKTNSSLREAMKRGAYPIELNKEEKAKVTAIYERARQLTKETGIEHHVDHIKPVSKGGTNHPSNLQILTAQENLRKSSKWEGD